VKPARVASVTCQVNASNLVAIEVGFPVRFSRGLKVLLPLLLLAYGFGNGEQSLSNWAESAGCVALLLGSVAVHEFGHVLVVQRLGLTVNNVTLTAFGGLTEYEGPPRSPLAQGLIAFAGPFASSLLAVALLAVRLAVGGNDVDAGLAGVLTFGVGTNVLITVVNLLPFPTLDGGQIVGSIWRGLCRGREHA
jgi:Zn-dependent protease